MEQLQLVTVSALHTQRLICNCQPFPSPAITCSTVAIPNNGSLDFGGASPDVRNNYALNVVATYNCDTGFSLVGDRTRMCTGEGSSSSVGTFDGVDPTCERKCIII